jgi:hypothetical protein
MIEILKILLPLLGGGAVGALLNEWFRRRRSKVQSVPLIERANRLTSPELRGFVLARVVNDNSGRHLQEVNDCREYQLTLRNSTDTHLTNAEIQFEFPAEEVEAWTSRPALSKTALEKVMATPSPPWQSAFRWVIPHFPSGDSVEFTFQAINPQSQEYAAALYKADGLILEHVVGEPNLSGSKTFVGFLLRDTIFRILISILIAALSFALITKLRELPDQATVIKLAGCELDVLSTSKVDENDPIATWRRAPAQIKYRLVNVGTGDCLVQSPAILLANPIMVRPGETLEKESYSQGKPKLTDVDVLLGSNSSSIAKGTAPVYIRQ